MASSACRPEDAKGELLRVRREMANVEDNLSRVLRELDNAAELGDQKRIDDSRHIRCCLWKEKEQLRIQETIFLRVLFPDATPVGSPVGPQGYSGDAEFLPPPITSLVGSNLVPQSPALKPMPPSSQKQSRRKTSSPPPPGPSNISCQLGGMYDVEMANPAGYEVNRSSDSKVADVWREWKEGINGNPAIEKLEEARKRDRKQVWWKHKNDYKYWSKQMRIIHAVEQKAMELGSIDAAIQFWEEILRVEFEGSISKLREALGGEKCSAEGREQGIVNEMSTFKRQRKELLQRGLDRLKQWPQASMMGHMA